MMSSSIFPVSQNQIQTMNSDSKILSLWSKYGVCCVFWVIMVVILNGSSISWFLYLVRQKPIQHMMSCSIYPVSQNQIQSMSSNSKTLSLRSNSGIFCVFLVIMVATLNGSSIAWSLYLVRHKSIQHIMMSRSIYPVSQDQIQSMSSNSKTLSLRSNYGVFCVFWMIMVVTLNASCIAWFLYLVRQKQIQHNEAVGGGDWSHRPEPVPLT